MTARQRIPLRFLAVALTLAFAMAALPSPADAKTLRWAGRGDMQTTDPHSQNENLTNNINQLVYEFLLTRDKKLGLQPALAESWTQVNPTTWRFKLRPGVKFHDGTPFTADDVVFSFERARSDTSQLRAYANASGIPKKIDDLTVEFTTNGPNPVELDHIVTINIMSKAWCEKNRATKPQNYTQKEDMITARQANGTGPYMLKAREPDVKTVLAKNPNWWGLKAGRFEGNADEVIYTPIVSDATRVAALLSGEVDLVNDPPPQDVPKLAQTPGIKVLEGTENRIVFIGMDQAGTSSCTRTSRARTRSRTSVCARRSITPSTSRRSRRRRCAGCRSRRARSCPRRSPPHPRSRSGSPSTRSRRRSCWRKPAIRTASR